MSISRRTALAGVVAMFGAQIFAPIARAANAGGGQEFKPTFNEGPPSVAIFNAEQRATLAALSERIIPTTDTPGAIAAGVPEYIEKLLADWAKPDERAPIVSGLDAMQKASIAQFEAPVATASAEQQDALLTQAMNNEIADAAGFFGRLRQLVITGYYTSEIGITQERVHLPVPGEYNGAYLYSDVNKVFSA